MYEQEEIAMIALRKVSFLLVLAALLMIGIGQAPTAEAYPVYVGTYSDGSDAYLLTDTVYIQSRHPYTFRCTVRYYNTYLEYSFFPSNGSPYYTNSEGYEGYVFGGQSPVAAGIYRYVVNNW